MKVSGYSLAPDYQPGDYVLISRIPIWLWGIRPGDVIVFDHPRHARMIKRVERLEAQGESLWVIGANEFSIDSRSFGPIPRSLVLGKVIWHVSKK